MIERHPDGSVERVHVFKTAELWAALRKDWEAGVTGPRLAKHYGVSKTNLYRRAKAEKWPRPGKPLPRSLAEPLVRVAPTDPIDIAELALARAAEALMEGRAFDALALIKAGDAVGAFAEFVLRHRAHAAGGRKGERPSLVRVKPWAGPAGEEA